MCKDSSEVVKVQNEWLNEIREEYAQLRENIGTCQSYGLHHMHFFLLLFTIYVLTCFT